MSNVTSVTLGPPAVEEGGRCDRERDVLPKG